MRVVCITIVTTLIFGVQSQIAQSDCRRICNGVPRTCSYYFEVDKFWTMAPDCLNCTSGTEAHCDQRLCFPGDGRRRMWRGINGVFPGPPIEVCRNDLIRVKVKNFLSPETLTIHWHGMHQKRTQHMDGVPMITQRSIRPNEEYLYEFTASEVGSHWYHSHSGSQRADGVYGNFIVRDHQEPVPEPYLNDMSEHVISFLEWFNATADEVLVGRLRSKDFYGSYEKSMVINGRGHTQTNRVPAKRFNVNANSTYRFRMLHAGNIVCPVEFSIDNHDLIVFNTDGNHFEPKTVQSLTMTNGERFDFVLKTNQPVGEYVMRFEGGLTCNVTGWAILHYSGAASKRIEYVRTRTFRWRLNCVDHRQPGCISYADLQHFGTVHPMLLRPPDMRYHVAFDLYNVANRRFGGVRANELYTPLLNNIAFKPPNEVLLCNPMYSDTCQHQTQITECTHMVSLPPFALIELILTDIGVPFIQLHPMHLHGHSFAVVGYRKFNESVDPKMAQTLATNGLLYINHTKPILKDTVGVPDGGTVIIRFITDNPGFWLFHCHVDFHAEEGMQMVFETGKYYLNCRKQGDCDCMCFN